MRDVVAALIFTLFMMTGCYPEKVGAGIGDVVKHFMIGYERTR